MKIKIKDSKTLLDSINNLKQKIKDAEVDLTKAGIKSIANALIEKKEEIGNTTGFAELRDLVKEVVTKFDTPKSREILLRVDDLDRLYKRDPRKGERNDLWLWEKLMKYTWNIILKAANLGSPDVKEVKEEVIQEDSCKMKDEEDEILQLAKLLGEAHDKLIEAQDLANSLEGEEKIASDLVYAIEDVEADLSELDFMGETDPKAKLLKEFGIEEESEEYEGEVEDWDL